MSIRLSVFISVILALMLVTPASAVVLTYWQDDSGSSSIESVAPSLRVLDDCLVTINGYADASNSIPAPITLINDYYSPHDVPLISGTKVFADDVSCYSFSNYSTDTISDNGTYEARTELTYNSDTARNYIKTIYDCDAGDDLYLNYTFDKDNGDYDSSGYIPNMMMRTASKFSPSPYTYIDLTPIYQKQTSKCQINSVNVIKDSTNINNAYLGTYTQSYLAYYYPFTTGAIGDFNYNLSCGTSFDIYCWSNNAEPYTLQTEGWLIYEYANPLSITLLGGSIVNGNIPLLANTEYVLMYYNTQEMPQSVTYKAYAPDFANFEVYAYEPDYSICGEWTECEDGEQRRVCEDANEIEDPIFEYRACTLPFIADVYLGFEEFTKEDNAKWFCEKGTFCLNVLTTIDAYTPVGWEIFRTSSTNANTGQTAYLENFDAKIDGDASEGSSSLSLWSIPIKEFEPIPFDSGTGDIITCGNYTKARFPEVYTFYNESLFIAYNITFDSPYAQIVYDVKKCSEPPVQWDYSGFLGCGIECYGNCDIEPKGLYGVRVVDIGEGIENYQNYAFKFFGVNGINWTSTVLYNDYFTTSQTHDFNALPNPKKVRIEMQGIYNFTNDTIVTLIFDPVDLNKILYITNLAGTVIYGQFNTGLNAVGKNIRKINLNNVPYGTKSVYIHDGVGVTGTIVILYDQVKVETWDTFPTYDIIYDTTRNSINEWTTREIDFSLLENLFEVGKNYTIAFGIKSSEYTSTSTCIYLDNVRVTYRSDVEDCSSKCNPESLRDYKEAVLEDGVCTYTIYENDYRCTGEDEETTEFCDGTTWVYLDSYNNWQEILNSSLCADVITEEEQLQTEIRGLFDEGLKLVGVELTDTQYFLLAFLLGVIIVISIPAYMSYKDVDTEVVLGAMVVIIFTNVIVGFWAWEIGAICSLAIILLFAEAIGKVVMPK